MAAPALVKPIPQQGVNERAAFGPLDLSEYIQAAGEDPDVHFVAGLPGGLGLPKGLICLDNGIITGLPAKGTQGQYEIEVTASNDEGTFDTKFKLAIMPANLDKNTQEYFDDLKQQIWKALDQNLPIPDASDLLERGITPTDIYYLLERWGTLKIYNVYDLSAPGEKHLLELQGVSEHYHVYDRGCVLVAAPKDLYSHERTLADGIATVQAMAKEAYQRGWTVELIGFEKLARAAWLELQHLGELNNKPVEIMNYDPSTADVRLYHWQADERLMKNLLENN